MGLDTKARGNPYFPIVVYSRRLKPHSIREASGTVDRPTGTAYVPAPPLTRDDLSSKSTECHSSLHDWLKKIASNCWGNISLTDEGKEFDVAKHHRISDSHGVCHLLPPKLYRPSALRLRVFDEAFPSCLGFLFIDG